MRSVAKDVWRTVTTRVCQDLVSYDMPDGNPFRGLLPLTNAQPLLQHIIVATSAAHMSNMFQPPVPITYNKVDAVAVCHVKSGASSRALRDALVAKQRALKLMHHAIKNIDSVDGDVVFAAALFFVNMELIESGKHGWRAHLEGACRIMALLYRTTSSNELLRDYMLSDCSV